MTSRVFAVTVFAFMLAVGAVAQTTNLTASVTDQEWRSNSTSNWVGGTTARVGSHTTGVHSGLVIPFWIPNLNGLQVSAAELQITIPTNTGLIYAAGAANADVYGVRSATNANTAASDYSSGTLAIDNWFNIKSNLTIGVKTASSAMLASWIDGQVGTTGGKYVFITVRPDAVESTYRYATINAADATTGKPQLVLTLTDPLVLSTNELAVDWNSPVNGPGTNWDTAFRTITGAVASTSFSATNRNVIRIKEGVYRERMNIGKSGVSGRPLIFTRAATNHHVVISGMKALTNWTVDAGTVYRTTEMGTGFVSAVFANNIVMPKAREPNSGWWAATSASAVSNAGASTVTLIDTNNLIGLTNSLAGATIEVWNLYNNIFTEVPIISFNSALGQIVFDATPWSDWINVSQGLCYGLMNQKSLADLPGEWAVVTGAVNTVYMKSLSGGVPSNIESPYLPGALVKSSNQSYLRFDGLEFAGAAYEFSSGKYVNWNSHNLHITGGRDIGVYNCISRGASNQGMELRNLTDVEVANCIIRKNWFGLDFNSCTNAIFRNSDIGYNKEDSFRVWGPSKNVQISSNYIHHTTAWGHSDTIQIAGTDGVPSTYPSNLVFKSNVILGGGQSTMTQATVNDLFQNNMYVGSEACMLILGHKTSGFHSVLNNTMALARYSNLSMDWRDYIVKSNIFFTGNALIFYSTASCTNYTGNYNRFYPAPRETNQNLFAATNYVTQKVEFYKTLAEFQATTGQDMNSTAGNPGFSNAPVGLLSIDGYKMAQMTTNTLILADGPKVSVGDKVEYDFDGILRTVTSVSATNTIVITPALAERPKRAHIFITWGSNTNNTIDLRSSQSAGSTVYIPGYQAGDFNNDGVRDIPAMPSYLQ